MSKLLNLSNFGKKGINTDLLPWDLPIDQVSYIKNIRISKDSLSPFGGYSSWFGAFPTGLEPVFLMFVGSTSGTFWLIAGDNDVYVYDGSALSQITNAAGFTVANPDLWSGCMLSEVAIITIESEFPQYWPEQNIGTTLEYLPWDATRVWSDVSERCGIIRSHKQFLFALKLTSGANELTDSVRWSSPADVGNLPESWDPLDITNVAGIVKLGGSGGKIVDGLSLRDAFVVYREGGITVFDYVGGQFVWQVRHLSTDVGLTSPDCIVDVKGVHYFIGDGDILTNDGNTITSLLHNRLRRRFITNYDPEYYANSYVVENNIQSEIWFCIPESGNVYPNVAYVYNYKDGSWSLLDIPQCPSASYGSRLSAILTWSNDLNSWSNSTNIWSKSQTSPLENTIISIAKAGVDNASNARLLLLDNSEDPSIFPYDTVVERLSFPLEGFHDVTTIQKIYPHISGSGSLKIQIGSQDHPGAPVRWKPEVTFTPLTDRKVDIRTTGELHCFRLFSDEEDGQWAFSGMDIDYVTAGKR